MILLTSMNFTDILKSAAENTLLGMGVVFFMLILICGLIYCLRFIDPLVLAIDKNVMDPVRGLFGRKKRYETVEMKTEQETQAVQAAPASRVAAPATARKSAPAPEPVSGIPYEVVAAVTAAIAEAEDVPADGIVIRSIRRVPRNNWKNA